MNPSSYTSTLLKAFDILDCFSSDSQEIGIKDISQKIDMPQSSVYRIIQSLEFAGMIYQNRENRKYRLGPKFIALSGRQSSLSGYMDIAMKYMKQLGHETSETVNLAMLDCDRVVYLHRVDSPHVLRPNFSLMERYSAVQTGLGLVLLADLNSAGLQWVYQNNADTLHIPYEEFTEQIAQIRRQGYAYDDQLFCEGLRCVAAPICGPGGKALFSISVSAPSLRMDDARYELVRQLVVRYSALAPALRPYYDLTVFLTCSQAEQAARLQAREGAYYPAFPACWIPLEEDYHRTYDVEHAADLVADTTAFSR